MAFLHCAFIAGQLVRWHWPALCIDLRHERHLASSSPAYALAIIIFSACVSGGTSSHRRVWCDLSLDASPAPRGLQRSAHAPGDIHVALPITKIVLHGRLYM